MGQDSNAEDVAFGTFVSVRFACGEIPATCNFRPKVDILRSQWKRVMNRVGLIQSTNRGQFWWGCLGKWSRAGGCWAPSAVAENS